MAKFHSPHHRKLLFSLVYFLPCGGFIWRVFPPPGTREKLKTERLKGKYQDYSTYSLHICIASMNTGYLDNAQGYLFQSVFAIKMRGLGEGWYWLIKGLHADLSFNIWDWDCINCSLIQSVNSPGKLREQISTPNLQNQRFRDLTWILQDSGFPHGLFCTSNQLLTNCTKIKII